MNTHETYVSLEVAKLLKEAGFDWSCRGYYDRQTLRFNFVWDHNGKGASTQCSAPTLDVAQRWLREVKKYHIYVRPYSLDDETYVTNIVITDSKWGSLQDDSKKAITFKTYEESLEAGIKKCLTLILEKDGTMDNNA